MKTILIFENDYDTLDLLILILRGEGYETVSAGSKMSLEKIAQLKPDVIVMDYKLDDGYGSELCLEIKTSEQTRHIPVMLVSATGNLKKVATDSYADVYMEKPFDIDEFAGIIKLLAEHRS